MEADQRENFSAFFFFHHLHQVVDLSVLCLFIVKIITLKQQQHSYFGLISVIIWKVLPAGWLGAGGRQVDRHEIAMVYSFSLSLRSAWEQLLR